jgi:hypothetical protein
VGPPTHPHAQRSSQQPEVWSKVKTIAACSRTSSTVCQLQSTHSTNQHQHKRHCKPKCNKTQPDCFRCTSSREH